MTFDPAGFSDVFSKADLRHRSVRFTAKAGLEGGTFYLVARYPLVFSTNSIFLIGLIVLLLLTILLLVFIIHFILSSSRHRPEFVSTAREKNDVYSDVVSQIDDALLRSRDLPVSRRIQEEKPSMTQVEKSDQKLIRDGIRIKKQEKGVLQ